MFPKIYEIQKKSAALIAHNYDRIGYIKGYNGSHFRVMTHYHEPLGNITKNDMDYLKHHGCVEVDGLVYKLIKKLP
jgi:hypothetical protein